MYVRLAFAVAAHLEPEILIVDEVLAVGDAQFQKKCLGKMEDVGKEGRTVIFVSHQMDAIQRLCNQCIWLDKGEVRKSKGFEATITEYLFGQVSQAEPDVWNDISRTMRNSGTRNAYFSKIKYVVPGSREFERIQPDGPVTFFLEVESSFAGKVSGLSISIYLENGFKLINMDIASIGQIIDFQKGTNNVEFQVPTLHLKPGSYKIGVWMGSPMGEVYDWVENAIDISVVEPVTESLGSKSSNDGYLTCNFHARSLNATTILA
jgi:lipopolysaccharide transport system ATP-binding protein